MVAIGGDRTDDKLEMENGLCSYHAQRRYSQTSRSEALLILTRDDESLDHLSVDEVAVELVELVQPEIIASKIGVRRVVWVPPQVTEVLHQHKRLV